MKRFLFITMIILLLLFMITPSIVYGAINPEALITQREISENQNYNTINKKNRICDLYSNMVENEGLEPLTSTVQAWRSSQLS